MSQRFRNIIRHYKNWKTQNPDKCIEYCASQSRLEDAIMCAALSIDATGRKHPHQYRLKNVTLQSFGESMIDQIDTISSAITFEDLIAAVQSAKIYGIGDLAIYDAAVRIGAFKNIWPDKIYLHAGAKVGASALINNLTENIIQKHQLPSDFQDPDLSCYELEDMLCIYKALFQHAKNIGQVY